MPQDTPLHKAANQGDVDGCKDIIEAGEIDVNAKGAAERTALMRACGGNHVQLVKVLLELGADPSQQDKAGRQALHWAAIGGHIEPLRILLETGKVNVNAKSKSQGTALHSACSASRTDIVVLLITHHLKVVSGEIQGEQLDFDGADGEGKTPLQYAKESKNGEIHKMVKEKRLLKEGEGGTAGCIVM